MRLVCKVFQSIASTGGGGGGGGYYFEFLQDKFFLVKTVVGV